MQKGEFTALDLTIKDMADSNPNMMIKEFNMPEDQPKAAAMDGLVGLKRRQQPLKLVCKVGVLVIQYQLVRVRNPP